MVSLDGLTMKTAKLPVKHKLTIEQVAEAIELLDSGVTFENVAGAFEIHRSTLARYIRGAELYGYSFWSRNPTTE